MHNNNNNNNNNFDKVNTDGVVWVITAQRVRLDDAWHPHIHKGKISKRNLKKGLFVRVCIGKLWAALKPQSQSTKDMWPFLW